MSILARQFEALRSRYPKATLTPNPDGSSAVLVPELKLKAGWNRPETAVAFVAPAAFPQAAPDCFWAEPALALAHGGPPQNTGRTQGPGIPADWLWFSWHPSTWNSNSDSLLTYLNVILRRLNEAR